MLTAKSLVLIIQSVDRESNRLTTLPDESISPAEELLLVDYEALADELEDAYAEVTQGQANLPDYKLLVTDRS